MSESSLDSEASSESGARVLHPVARLPEEWAEALLAAGERSFRAAQVFRWIHAHGEFEPERMSNLGAGLKTWLKGAGLAPPLTVHSVQRSSDGTRKLLLKLEGGGLVECVLIPMTDDPLDADAAAVDDSPDDDASDEPSVTSPKNPTRGRQVANLPSKRVTLCISTQVGCAMGCVFCASGQAGLKRGLVAAEIVSQVLISKRYLDEDEQLRNLVFMGMGEPLHHYEQTARAIRLITHPEGLAMGLRRITVSTVGLVPGIRRLGKDFGGKVGLAVSLHAPDDETRDKIMPINRRFNVEQLITALHEYPLPNRKRITIEYTLMQGVNDSPRHARRLAARLKGLRVKVNLIPMNPIEQSELRAPEENSVDMFREVLAELRVSCSVRKRRGDDVDAACGQLALKSADLAAPGLVQLRTLETRGPNQDALES